VRARPFFLFGHSQGGQFVHRFVLAHPEVVARAAACASGNYVHPDPETVFPWGTKANPFTPDLGDLDFGRLVQSRLAIIIGTADLERRRDEALRFLNEVRQYGPVHNLSSHVESFTVPDGPHSGKSNYPTASRFLFRELPPWRPGT
jgi:pimeloyl-ACP methyl ester carboxylesterase